MQNATFILANGNPISIHFDREKSQVQVFYESQMVFSSPNFVLFELGLPFTLGESRLQIKLVRTWLGERVELIENGQLALAGTLPAARAWKGASDLLLAWAVMGAIQALAVCMVDWLGTLAEAVVSITGLLGAGQVGFLLLLVLGFNPSGAISAVIWPYFPLCLAWLALVVVLRRIPNRSVLMLVRALIWLEMAVLLGCVSFVLYREGEELELVLTAAAIGLFVSILARGMQLRCLQKMKTIYPHLNLKEATQVDILDDLPQ